MYRMIAEIAYFGQAFRLQNTPIKKFALELNCLKNSLFVYNMPYAYHNKARSESDDAIRAESEQGGNTGIPYPKMSGNSVLINQRKSWESFTLL